MASVTWKGEPVGPEDEGPKSITWGGKTFKKGEAVEIEDPAIIAKAQGNPFFEVSGAEATPPPPPEQVTYPPPSQQSAQGPVPKAGEPVRPGAPAVGPLVKPPPRV
jgi:hypothetical protein